jgi:hypothetical protein
MPRSYACRSSDLARRIESSGSVSRAACLACRRSAHQCIRSVVSVRCARCVRRNQRCLAFTSGDGYNPYVSTVRADIRRLRASLTSLERFVSFSNTIPRSRNSDDDDAASNSASSDTSDSLDNAAVPSVDNANNDPFDDGVSVGADDESADAHSAEVFDASSAVEAAPPTAVAHQPSSPSVLAVPYLLNSRSPSRKLSFYYQGSLPVFDSDFRIGSPRLVDDTVPFVDFPLFTDYSAIDVTSSDAPSDYIDPAVLNASFPASSADWYPVPPAGFADFALFLDLL